MISGLIRTIFSFGFFLKLRSITVSRFANADLRRRQPDALRVVHRLEHVRHQLAQVVVELRHRIGGPLQDRIGKFNDR